MTNIEQDMPGVIFYVDTLETFRKLVVLQETLSENGIVSVWSLKSWHGEQVKTLEVYAHGNTVAPFLAVMKYVH